MRLLLDTHAFLWMSLDDPQLSKAARKQLSDLGNEVFLSPASYWEIAIKVSIGKLELMEPLVEFVGREVRSNGLNILPIDVEHANSVSKLPFHHKDPFDRLIIAQAKCEEMSIVGCDGVFKKYQVPLIW